MKKSATAQIQTTKTPECLVGVYSKKAAADRIVHGCRHLHSTPLGDKDPGVQITRANLKNPDLIPYSWEPKDAAQLCELASSQGRFELIQAIVMSLGLKGRRSLGDTVTTVLEEMISNAIYHPYRNDDGTQKYSRKQVATLAQNESVCVQYASDERGVYLSVGDQGGTITFDQIANSFKRCYGEPSAQIEQKDSGAGLGIYMVFEAATHFKLVTYPDRSAEMSCWIADKRSYDPEVFSFNFYERR